MHPSLTHATSPDSTLDSTSGSTPVRLRSRHGLDQTTVDQLARAFEHAHPSDVIAWAVDRFGPRLCLSASFADTVLIELATRVLPDIEVVFIDTGMHFPETLATVKQAMVRYGLNLTVLRPSTTAADVWAHGIDTCCGSRKVAPLDRHLVANADAWMSGMRRVDDPARAATPVVELDRRGLVKVNPLATWSEIDLQRYVRRHDVLVNPLHAQGYPSIGCWPCTEPAAADDGRAGRWAGMAKTECGLHT